jgi:hypothetical protein
MADICGEAGPILSMTAPVGDGRNFIGHRLGQIVEEVLGNHARGAGMKLGIGELRGAIHGPKHIQLANFCSHLAMSI